MVVLRAPTPSIEIEKMYRPASADKSEGEISSFGFVRDLDLWTHGKHSHGLFQNFDCCLNIYDMFGALDFGELGACVYAYIYGYILLYTP